MSLHFQLLFVAAFVYFGFLDILNAQRTNSDDDFAAIHSGAELGTMDYVWLVYAVIALLTSLLCVVPFGPCNYWCQNETYDGMSDECYTEILTARGYESSRKAMGDNRQLSLLVLRADLQERYVWQNDMKKDFVAFIRNEHALFATCYSHKDHPFSRKDRRLILISVLMLDFGIAMLVTYSMAYGSFNDTTEFILDYCISYFFGMLMSTLEHILVQFAVCAGVEKCPTCIRGCAKCCGSTVLFTVFMWALFGFIIAVVMIGLLSSEPSAGIFWQIFALNFVVGLIQAWFLIDLIKMMIDFRGAWKQTHPPPPGPEREEEEEKKRSRWFKSMVCCFKIWCCCLVCLVHVCCKKKEKPDPYDDLQGDLGVNYHEYLAWKNEEDIGKRQLPKAYQMKIPSLSGMVDSSKKKAIAAKDNAIASVAIKKHEITSGITGAKGKANTYKSKLKAKKLAMQMKLSKKNVNDSADAGMTGDDETQNVELVVGNGDETK